MKIIDISMPVGPGQITYPSAGRFRVSWPRRLETGNNVSMSELTFVPHLGTHVDTPAHTVLGGEYSDAVSLERLIGEAVVIDVSGNRVITERLLREWLGPMSHPIVLIRTGYVNCAETGKEFDVNYPYFNESGADYLIASGARTVGVDTPSVDLYGDKSMVIHKRLLGNGVALLENLRLSDAVPGVYLLMALPLRLQGIEALPTRAILIQDFEKRM